MNAAILLCTKSVFQGTMCDTIRTPLPQYVTVGALAKNSESSAPLL
jgi:hypothetical protein